MVCLSALRETPSAFVLCPIFTIGIILGTSKDEKMDSWKSKMLAILPSPFSPYHVLSLTFFLPYAFSLFLFPFYYLLFFFFRM
jgi:hypothetical protein